MSAAAVTHAPRPDRNASSARRAAAGRGPAVAGLAPSAASRRLPVGPASLRPGGGGRATATGGQVFDVAGRWPTRSRRSGGTSNLLSEESLPISPASGLFVAYG